LKNLKPAQFELKIKVYSKVQFDQVSSSGPSLERIFHFKAISKDLFGNIQLLAEFKPSANQNSICGDPMGIFRENPFYKI